MPLARRNRREWPGGPAASNLTRRTVLAALAAVFTVPAASAGAEAEPAPLSAAATTAMIGDAVREVGGARVTVTVLMGEGVDPHTYRQTASDVAALVRARAVFWHGLHLEAQFTDLMTELARRKPVIALGERVAAEKLLRDAASGGKPDPHIWMDPRLWCGVVLAARDALTSLDPAGAALFAANAARYTEEIGKLADYAGQVLATVPESQRVLVTPHDAFNYFGRAYGYEVVGIQGISTENEAGLRQIETVADLIVRRRIPAVFVESSVSPRNVQALIEGAAVRGHRVTVGGSLFSDAMGRPGTYEGTYIGMMDHNITAIARALGGQAPAAGANGRLAAGRHAPGHAP